MIRSQRLMSSSNTTNTNSVTWVLLSRSTGAFLQGRRKLMRRLTPAVYRLGYDDPVSRAAGISDHLWTVEELCRLLESN